MPTSTLNPGACFLCSPSFAPPPLFLFDFPADVLKVRMQLQNAKSDGMRVGMVRTAASLLSSEGPRAFYTGLGPALARGVFYGGTRLGLYSPLRDAISAALDGGGEGNRGGEASTSYGRSHASPSPPSFGAGLAAGCLSGCAAAALTKCVLVFFVS
jgi:hypothetical protein